ncbi:MAG: hypothetical protein MZU95_06590 [Desulfomicrobium escambiense]|nr:hypothetical protein [Desulfomicrobium escambiense]
MPLYFKGNFLAAARVSKGVPARDNYSVGLSLAHGDVLETMGYTLVGPEPLRLDRRGDRRDLLLAEPREPGRDPRSGAATAPASSSSSGGRAWPCSTRAGSRSRPSRSSRGAPGPGIIPSAPD